MTYRFGILRAGTSDGAIAHNVEFLGDYTLGVEVTQPVLAQFCFLGNIDPQHSSGGEDSSAIEEALKFDIPSNLKTLVTMSLDKDSIGAMAVIVLRTEGRIDDINRPLVCWIGALDRGPYRDAREKHPELNEMFDRTTTDAMNAIIHQDHPLFEKVSLVGKVLTGEMSIVEMTWWCEQIQRAEHKIFHPELYGDVAFFYVPGEYREAREYGNREYELAVIFDPEKKTVNGSEYRWCVVRQELPYKVFDRVGFEDAVNNAEATKRGITREMLRDKGLEWGGPPNLIVSPSGISPWGEENDLGLSPEEIIGLVREHLESGVVT